MSSIIEAPYPKECFAKIVGLVQVVLKTLTPLLSCIAGRIQKHVAVSDGMS